MSTTEASKAETQKWWELINYSIPPFSFIKQQSFADKCSEVTFKPGNFIINNDSESTDTALDGLYIVAEGIVGIGDTRKDRNKKDYWIERSTAAQGAVIGELEIPIEFIIAGEKRDFPTMKPSQSAWPSSDRLKWFIAYEETDRKRLAKEVKTLKVPLNIVNEFMKVSELKEWVLFDQFRKARQYYLNMADYIHTGKQLTRDQDIFIRSKHLYEQRKAAKCTIGGAVYIIGLTRYEILVQSRQLVGKTDKGILNDVKETAKGENFDIEEISVKEFKEKIPHEMEDLFFIKKGSHQNASQRMVGRLIINKNEKIFRLSPCHA